MKPRLCHRCGEEFQQTASYFCSNCGAQRRWLQASDILKSDDVDEIIEYYFTIGTKYQNIVLLLETQHGIRTSLRNLKRHLKSKSLSRKSKGELDDPIWKIIEKESLFIWHKYGLDVGFQ